MKIKLTIILIALMLLLRPIYAQVTVTKSIKADFGAVGDGVTDDMNAFKAAASFFNARGGEGTLIIEPGTYIVGKQIPATLPSDVYQLGVDVLPLTNCLNMMINGQLDASGNRPILKYRDGLKYGSFCASNGLPYYPSCSVQFTDGTFAATLGTCILLIDCNNVQINNLEIDGNMGNQNLGGRLGDTGYQIPYTGLGINRCKNIFVSNCYAHHLGLDGIMVREYDKAPESDMNIQISNSDFTYNGRQALTWTGGKGLSANNCRFNYTGQGAIRSAPASGLDIEYEGESNIENGSFTNCEFLHNAGNGIVADHSGSLGDEHRRNFSFTNCTIGQGSYNSHATWIRVPQVTFTSCQIYGDIYFTYDATNNLDATEFNGCNISDQYNGNAFESFAYMLETNGGRTRIINCLIETHCYARLISMQPDPTNRAFIKNTTFISHGLADPGSYFGLGSITNTDLENTFFYFPNGYFMGLNNITHTETNPGTFYPNYIPLNTSCYPKFQDPISSREPTCAGFTGLNPNYCFSSGNLPVSNLVASVYSSGSYFSGPGITNTGPGQATFDPLQAIGQTVTISYNYINSCGSTEVYSREANIGTIPTASANAGVDQIICSTDGVSTMQANLPSLATGFWAVVSGNPTISQPTAPNSNVTVPIGQTAVLRWYLTPFACPQTWDDIELKSYASPATPVFTLSSSGVCRDAQITAQVAIPASPLNYTWTKPVGSISIATITTPAGFSETIKLPIAGASNFELQYTDPVSGCTSVYIQVVQVGNNTTPVFTLSSNSVCLNSEVTAQIEIPALPLDYNWIKPAGVLSIGTIITPTGFSETIKLTTSGALTFELQYTDAVSGCTSVSTQVVQVGTNPAPPLPDFTLSSSSVCLNGQITASVAYPPSPYTYSWTMPAGAQVVSASGGPSGFAQVIKFTQAGTQSFSLKYYNANTLCENVLSKTIFVNANPTPPIPDFTLSTTTACLNGQINVGVAYPPSPFSYEWIKPAGAQQVSASGGQFGFGEVLKLTSTGTNTFQLRYYDANTMCESTVSKSVIISANPAPPLPEFSLSESTSCKNGKVDAIVSIPPSPFSYTWTRPSGAQVISVSGGPTGFKETLKLTQQGANIFQLKYYNATTMCEHTVSKTIVVSASLAPTINSISIVPAAHCGYKELTINATAANGGNLSKTWTNVNTYTGGLITSVTANIVVKEISTGCTAKDKVSYALDCAGIEFYGNQILTAKDLNNNYDLGSGRYTLEALIRLKAGTAGSGERTILSRSQNSSDGYHFRINANGTRLILRLNGVNYQSPSFTTLYDGSCHHVAVTRHPSTGALQFYLDGASIGSVSSFVGTTGLPSSKPVIIGASSFGATGESLSNYFVGEIHEVRIWGLVRSAADINTYKMSLLSSLPAPGNPITGLLLNFRFDENFHDDILINNGSTVPAPNNGFLGDQEGVVFSDLRQPERVENACFSGDRVAMEELSEIASMENTVSISASPNPFDSDCSIQITGSNEESINIQVFDFYGKIIMEKKYSLNEGSLLIGRALPTGIYFLRAASKNWSSSLKLIKFD